MRRGARIESPQAPRIYCAQLKAGPRADAPTSSVCLSVRLFLTCVICNKIVEYIIGFLSRSDRPIILVFCHQGSLRKSDGFIPNGGAK